MSQNPLSNPSGARAAIAVAFAIATLTVTLALTAPARADVIAGHWCAPVGARSATIGERAAEPWTHASR